MEGQHYAVVSTRDDYALHLNLRASPLALLRASKSRLDAMRLTLEPYAMVDAELARLYYEIDEIEHLLIGCVAALSQRPPSH